MSGHKAIVINQFWAGIISSLIASVVVGGCVYAWNANAQMAVTQEKVQQLEDARLPSRLDKLEEKVESTQQSVDDVKKSQTEMSGKIDLLVQDMLRQNRMAAP